MAFSGCRPEVQGDHLGLDGLKIKDLPDLKIEGDEAFFTKIPALVIVRENLSKTGFWYPTFFPQEGCEIILEILNQRIRAGEKLNGSSGIIVTSDEQARRSKSFEKIGIKDESPFLRTTKISDSIDRQ